MYYTKISRSNDPVDPDPSGLYLLKDLLVKELHSLVHVIIKSCSTTTVKLGILSKT